MSGIGPRPGLWNQDLLTAERDKYGANDVKPGLTGWAQINGRDELEIPEKVSKFLNKRTIGELAIKHGLNFLESTAVKKGEIPENLEYPVITKAIDSTVGGWKNDMYIEDYSYKNNTFPVGFENNLLIQLYSEVVDLYMQNPKSEISVKQYETYKKFARIVNQSVSSKGE